jgi:hypothetical protein
VIGLVIENMRTTVSSVNGAPLVMSRCPALDEWTSLPERLIAMCQPANFFWST